MAKPFAGHAIRAPLRGETMGTHWSLNWCAPESICADHVRQVLNKTFARIIGQMSNWEPTSEVSRFNNLGSGESLGIGIDFALTLSKALQIAEQSNGAFDPCCGAEIVQRGFGENVNLPPSRRTLTGISAWKLLKNSNCERHLFQPGGIWLNLSAIAKGYAVDLAANVLSELNLRSFLMEIGGEFVGKGVKPDGLPWWVEIKGHSQTAFRLALCNMSVATSGHYRKIIDGPDGKISHIVAFHEPNESIEHLISVSVIHMNCATADAWATALCALPPQEALKMAEEHKLAAIFQFWNAPTALTSRARNYQS